jgi:lysophospholipase L1-like esterase
MIIKANDERLNWQGAVSLEEKADGVVPWRIPFAERKLYNEVLAGNSAAPSGVRISFMSDTTSLGVKFAALAGLEDGGGVDLCLDGKLQASEDLAGKDSCSFRELPAGEKLLELWMPLKGNLCLETLELDEKASLSAYEDKRPKWVTYGSSITHCAGSGFASRAWPTIAAYALGVNLTNLGYGGQCHIDPMVPRFIRELPADLISLCLGINIQGGATMSHRTFRPAVIGAVKTIRDKHPDTPMLLMSPICSPPRETAENQVGLNLVMMREEIETAFNLLREHGDANLHYLAGLDLLGPEDDGLSDDKLHPNDKGNRIMAENFAKKARALLRSAEQ